MIKISKIVSVIRALISLLSMTLTFCVLSDGKEETDGAGFTAVCLNDIA